MNCVVLMLPLCRTGDGAQPMMMTIYNTQAEMREEATLYLSTGCQEFWIVNPKRKDVTVMRREGGTVVYEIGGQIPLPLFDGELGVEEIFS
jgi:Uma2 family endonuclease